MSRLIELLTSRSMFLMVIRYGGAGAGFVTQLILARLLAPESLGLYFAAMSLAAVVSTIVAFGYPEIAPRFLSRYLARDRTDMSVRFIRQGRHDILLLSALASALIAVLAILWPEASMQERLVFIVAAVWLPVLGILEFNTWLSLSYRSYFLAYGINTFLTPLLFLVVVGSLFLLGAQPDGLQLFGTFAAISTLMALCHWLFLRPLLPKTDTVTTQRVDRRIVSRWRREGGLLIPVSIYNMLFADLAILLTALLMPKSDLAAFAIALKIAMLIGFAVQVAHQVIIPDLADAHAQKRLATVGDTMRTAAILPVGFTLAAFLGSVLFGDRILAIFHPDFAKAQGVLSLLIACQVLRALAGPVVQLLTVIGAQIHNAALCIASMIILAVFTAILIPMFGLDGAGWAIFATWTFALTASAVMLHRVNGMRCDVVALFQPEQLRTQTP